MSRWMIEPESIKATAINSRVFGNLTVSFEIADIAEGFYHRLVCGEFHTEWSGYYEGLDTLKVDNRIFIAGTCYGLLPMGEVPYELIP